MGSVVGPETGSGDNLTSLPGGWCPCPVGPIPPPLSASGQGLTRSAFLSIRRAADKLKASNISIRTPHAILAVSSDSSSPPANSSGFHADCDLLAVVPTRSSIPTHTHALTAPESTYQQNRDLKTHSTLSLSLLWSAWYRAYHPRRRDLLKEAKLCKFESWCQLGNPYTLSQAKSRLVEPCFSFTPLGGEFCALCVPRSVRGP
ncbi:hypothetical protein V8F20_002140 [Naviculisporaceae sp. PSN 640]